MNIEVIIALASLLVTIIGAFITIFVKCGKLLQKIASIEESVEENKLKSIESDKDQNTKIEKNKESLEELIEKVQKALEEELKEKVNELKTADGDLKFDFNSFRVDVTTNLLVKLKENMQDLVAAELTRLKETDLSYISENIEENKCTIEEKISKLEKKIENIEYKDIRPIKETIAELKQQLKDR